MHYRHCKAIGYRRQGGAALIVAMLIFSLAAALVVAMKSEFNRYYQRSDHYNFAKKGIPVVFFCDGEHPDYHQVTDEAERLDYARMEAVARLAYWTAYNAAESPSKPQTLGRQSGW